MKIIPKAQSQGFGVYLINLTASSSPAAGEVIFRKTTLNARSSRSAAAFLTSLMVMVTSAISENNFCTISARYWIVTSPSNKKSIFAWKRRKKQTNKIWKTCCSLEPDSQCRENISGYWNYWLIRLWEALAKSLFMVILPGFYLDVLKQ